MLNDPRRLDRLVALGLARWREAVVALRAAPDAEPASPLAELPALRSAATLGELEALGAGSTREPSALAAWVVALTLEHTAWREQVDAARRWRAPVVADANGTARSSHELRALVLAAASPTDRQRWASAWAPAMPLLGGRAVRALRDRERRAAQLEARVAWAQGGLGVGAQLADEVATALLSVTEPLAHERRGLAWWDAVEDVLGRQANEGWPARLTARWVGEVLGDSAIGPRSGARLTSLPAPLGAASFARALGAWGCALLDAARLRCPWFATHQLPFGPRRHVRAALFASIVFEPPFARTVLGLGRERARRHRRMLAQAAVRGLRLQALRARLRQAARLGQGELPECWSALAPVTVGRSAPLGMLGVFPELWPADGAALVGQVLAARERASLVVAFGDDWYRNPRAAEQLAAADARPGDAEPIRAEHVHEALGELARALAEALC